jgi:hypothetical protein
VTLCSDIIVPRMMCRTAGQGELDLCPCVSSSCALNGLVLSLPNIAHPHFCWGSQRHRSAFHSPILHPILNEIRFASFFFPRSITPSATDHNTKANKWFCFLYRRFPGILATTDVRERDYHPGFERSRRERCSYSTKLCVLSLVIFFLLIFPCFP